jgi:hypothetical protein
MRRMGVAVAAAVVFGHLNAVASSALATLAPAVARDIGSVPATTIVVPSPLTSDVPAPRGDELAGRIASLVAGKLGATVHAQPAPLSVARALAAKGAGLVYLQVEVIRGELRATADLYPPLPNGWDRIRAPAPAPRAHAFVSARLDAEARSFLSPIALESARVHKYKHDLGDVLAAACGDIDGDGGLDLALISRTTVAWGHLYGGVFVVSHSAPWSALLPRAPVPIREPLATAVVVQRPAGGGAALYVGLTDRGGAALSPDLLGAAPLTGLPIGARGEVACAVMDAPLGAFAEPPRSCAWDSKAKAVLEVPAVHYDALAIFDLVDRDGSARPVLVAREPGGKLSLAIGGSTIATEGAGAQVAVADLDLDGAPEVVTTTTTDDDAVIVSTLRGSELRPRLRFPAPAGVRALTICPPEERGVPALVAVVGPEVWVVR